VGKRKRGRPRKPNKQLRPTTRAGRRLGADPIDHGSPLLRARKVNFLGRVDLELTPAGMLRGRGVIDEAEAIVLQVVEVWIARARLGRTLRTTTIDGLWSALLSGQAGGKWTPPVIAGDNRTGADHAWARLLQLRDHFAATGELAELGLVLRVAEGVGLPGPAEMGAFQVGLHSVSRFLERRPRR
jgi:hypothetical protein